MWPFDQNNQQMYQQYAQAYDTNNYYGIDNNQVWGHLFQFMRGAPMDMQQRIYQQHFDQMPYEQRVALAQQMPPGYYMDPNDTWSMAQSFHRLGQEQPNMIQRIMSHPLLTGAALGLVGLVAKHALSQHRQNAYQEQYEYQQPQYGYNQGFQPDPYAQQQLYQEQQEVRELRRELRQEEQEERREERREERFEERERHHHRDEW
ncbi:MAG: hypothetical protein JO031_08820 [Ktedonobacteraceae bacterium]|nr:hypothetical protein [Ktedonobacteraceae bacterium]